MNRLLSAVRMSRVPLCAFARFSARRRLRRGPADGAAVDAAEIDDARRALGAVAVDAVMRREEVAVERLERVGAGLQRNLEMVATARRSRRRRSAGSACAGRARLRSASGCAQDWSRSASARSTSDHSRPESSRGKAMELSCSMGAKSRPVADSTPGCGGTAIRRMPSSRAERGRMQRAAAAQRQERVAAGIDAAADRDQPDRLRHLGIEDAMDAERRMVETETERTRDGRFDRPAARGRARA